MSVLLAVFLLAAPAYDEEDIVDDDEEQDVASEPDTELEAPSVVRLDAPLKALSELRKEALAKKRYAFCHEERTLVVYESIEFCRVLGTQNAADCPAWETICKRLLAEKIEPETAYAIPHWIRWLLLVVLIAGVAALIARFLPERFFSRAPREGAEEPDATLIHEVIDEAHTRVETDVTRLLALAERAAAGGAFLEAIDHAYAALLRRLEWNRVITVTKDSTNGDYLREVSANAPDLRAPFRRIARELEHAHFAGEGADQERFSRVNAWVREALQQTTVAALLLALITLSGCFGPGPKETWPVGHGAFVDVLRGYGFDVHERLAPVESFDDVETLLLLPGTEISEAQWQALEERTADSRTCIVAMGGSYDWPTWFHAEQKAAHSDGILRARETELGKAGLRLKVPMQRAVVPTDEDFVSVIHDDASIYMLKHRTNCVVLFGDDALFTNVAMLDDSNLFVVTETLRFLGKRIDIMSEVTGISATNPAEIMSRARLLPVMLQLAAFLLILFFARGAHFGTPSEAPSAARRALSEHARAMGLLYAKARANEHAKAVLAAFRSRSWKRRI